MLTADRVVGAVVLVKAVDVVARGPADLPGPLWLAVLILWLAGGTAVLLHAASARMIPIESGRTLARVT